MVSVCEIMYRLELADPRLKLPSDSGGAKP